MWHKIQDKWPVKYPGHIVAVDKFQMSVLDFGDIFLVWLATQICHQHGNIVNNISHEQEPAFSR